MDATIRDIEPDFHEVSDWLARMRQRDGLDQARRALRGLQHNFPKHQGLLELAYWHDPFWWRSIKFGGIHLERRGPQHFEFIWSVVLDRDFANRLKFIPGDLNPRDLLTALTRDSLALIPEHKSLQWVVMKNEVPIGLSMFVNINFRNRTAEQIMGILPPFDTSFLVGDAYCASLLFAFNCMGLNKVQGLIYGSNESVATQQERLGFRREGVLSDAFWNETHKKYDDLVQIAMLRRDFDQSRVLQRHIKRQAHDRFLDEHREHSRTPLRLMN